jgi:5'-3' exonuclease
VRAKFGVPPEFIADYLALVGDSADGYPGIAGCGAKTAARLIERYGRIEDFPPDALGGNQASALLFKNLAVLRADEPLFDNVDALEWRGVTDSFADVAERFGDAGLVDRLAKIGSVAG